MWSRRSLAVRMHCRIRRLARKSRPVRLGQTPVGLIVAAALILLWGLERPAKAEFVRGSSESEYFTLSWAYDLEASIGSIHLRPKDDPGVRHISLQEASFTTRGVILNDPSYIFGLPWPAPIDLGTENGRHILQYKLNQEDVWCPLASAIGLSNFTFSGTQVELVPSKMVLAGDIVAGPFGGLSGMSGIVGTFGPLEMDFVSVQAIPEPSTIALAGAAAAAAASLKRRREEDAQREDA